jgi:type IV pilus assembly protein PilP
MRNLSLGLVVIVLLSACGNDGNGEIKLWMEESSRELKGVIPPLPELKPFPVVSYNAADKIDPFNALRIDPERKESGGAGKPDFDRPKEQLEGYPLETISFIGIVNKTRSNAKHAVVQVDGVVYQVGKGNYMGQNYGRIVDIKNSEIVLKEIVQDPSGQTSDWVERQMTLQLQEGSQGKELKK